MFTGLLLTLIQSLVTVLWPSAPGWAGEVIAGLLPLVAELVTEKAGQEMSGDEKMRSIVKEVRELADEAFDDIPGWKTYPEKRRDRIIGGLAELALFLHEVSDSKAVKKLGRKLRRRSKR